MSSPLICMAVRFLNKKYYSPIRFSNQTQNTSGASILIPGTSMQSRRLLSYKHQLQWAGTKYDESELLFLPILQIALNIAIPATRGRCVPIPTPISKAIIETTGNGCHQQGPFFLFQGRSAAASDRRQALTKIKTNQPVLLTLGTFRIIF